MPFHFGSFLVCFCRALGYSSIRYRTTQGAARDSPPMRTVPRLLVHAHAGTAWWVEVVPGGLNTVCAWSGSLALVDAIGTFALLGRYTVTQVSR